LSFFVISLSGEILLVPPKISHLIEMTKIMKVPSIVVTFIR